MLGKNYIILLILLLGLARALEFGELENKECSRVDYGRRVYLAVVFDDNFSLRECLSTTTEIGDNKRVKPSRCWKAVGMLFAEFNIYDAECTPYWSNITHAGCSSKAYGYRSYRAQLENVVPGFNPRTACTHTRGTLSGVFESMQPSLCHIGDSVTGEFHIKDNACIPFWSNFTFAGCSSREYGHCFYRAQLENLAPGFNAYDACMETIASLPDVFEFKYATVCHRDSATGEFHVPDSDCEPYWSNFTDTGCSSVQAGIRVYRAQMDNFTPGLDTYRACTQTKGELDGVFDLMQPSVCQDNSTMGYFHIKDDSCVPGCADEQDPLATSTYIIWGTNKLSMRADGTVYSSRSAVSEALFDFELIREDLLFALRHVATGRYLSVSSDGQLQSSYTLGEQETFDWMFNDLWQFQATSHLGTHLGFKAGKWATFEEIDISQLPRLVRTLMPKVQRP